MGYPELKGRLPTRYSPVRQFTRSRRNFLLRLACVKHAASVRPEPGSNSPLYVCLIVLLSYSKFRLTLRTLSISKNKLFKYYFAVLAQQGKLEAFKKPPQDFIYIILKYFLPRRQTTLIILIFASVSTYHLIQILLGKYLTILDFHSYHCHPTEIDIDQDSYSHFPIQIAAVHLN